MNLPEDVLADFVEGFTEILGEFGEPVTVTPPAGPPTGYTLAGEAIPAAGSASWVGRAVIIPMDAQRAALLGSVAGAPMFDVFLPPDAPPPGPAVTVVDALGARYVPTTAPTTYPGICYHVPAVYPGGR